MVAVGFNPRDAKRVDGRIAERRMILRNAGTNRQSSLRDSGATDGTFSVG